MATAYITPIVKPSFKPSFRVWTDASDFAWGGFYPGCTVFAQGYLTLIERLGSSTARELIAILYVLRAFVHMLKPGDCFLVNTDSQNAEIIINGGGSTNLELHQIALDILVFAISRGVKIRAHWILREKNMIADYISKIFDKDDWMLNPVLFAMLDTLWGRHDIDRFGSHLNHLVDRFNSYFDPHSQSYRNTHNGSTGNRY